MCKIFLILCILLSASCVRRDESKDFPLTLEKIDYTGKELKTDGYYYRNFNSGSEPFIGTCFFYRNGIFLNGTVFSVYDTIEKEENFRNGFYVTIVASKYKDLWGVFQIDGNQIKYEHWIPTEGGFYRTTSQKGTILNDTTFIINFDNGLEVTDWTYHFKQFSPKPDSTNRFIP